MALVILLSFMVIAFFSMVTTNRQIENTSAGGVTARLLAEGAVGAIQADLRQEIIAGSTAVGSGNSTVYYPNAPANMVPKRAVNVSATDPNFFNVVKQSGAAASPAGIINFTANNPTTTAASNGRLVSAIRWSVPMLTGAEFATGNTPNWVYVNPTGYSAAPTANTIGRIAFNVYDIGGLLDANVAGFAPKEDGGDPAEMPTKGGTVWADLTAIPGIKASEYKANDAWPPKWRITGNWSSFTSEDPETSLPFYHRTGWRIAYLGPQGESSDRMFASRQDLIRYAKVNTATFQQTNGLIPALQYLTTFSRDLERPTFRPAPDRPKVQQDIGSGGNDAKDKDDEINPALASQVNADGNLAIKKRFPLSRLALVSTPVPPAAPGGDAAKIREYFGLTWDGTNNRWLYNQSTANRILRLSEVPGGRDPDFFELLKAALTVGSLGKQFGFSFPASYNVSQPSSRLGGDDGRVEDQIVQIAANIIDQADRDSYPSRIQFNGRTFYGIEDLPRIYRGHETSYNVGRMTNFGIRNGAGPLTNAAWLYVTMVYPELWNPHRPSPAPAGPAPANFRIVARTFTPVSAEAAYLWNATGTVPQAGGNGGYFNDFRIRPSGPDCSTRIDYKSGEGANSSNTNASITFNLGTGDASFREPRPLSAVGYPAGSNANGSPNTSDMALNALAAPGQPDTVVQLAESAVPPPLAGDSNTYRSALGFVASYLPMINAGVMARWLNIMRGLGGPVALELQYKDPSNAAVWWAIDKMDISYANDIRFAHIQSHVANRADPRSSRWGSLYSIPNGYGYPSPWSAATPNRYDTGYTANPSAGTFSVLLSYSASQAPGWTGAVKDGLLGYLQENLPGSPLRYTDPDDILRGADAKYSSGDVGRPMTTGNTNSRPVVLNRPFRSVAELGNVFRDTPWRSLDFMTAESGDRALLDVFSVSDTPEDGIVAGRVNLNTRQKPVIAALIQKASMATGASITNAEALEAAEQLTVWTASTAPEQGPLSDRSEIVGRFVSGNSFKGPLEAMANKLASSDRPIKTSREAIVRALADAGTTRSWGFLIDVISQSGKLSATGGFLPEGESRLWNSVAIDRFTAKIIGQSNESIQE
jgi:hypothetical protein